VETFWQQILGIAAIALAVWAVAREVEVRLVILAVALTLGLLAWNPQAVVREFFNTFSNEKFVIPLCSAMGFSHVMRHTGCDQHLVHLLVKPLAPIRFLLVPGTVLVGFLVNMPVVSQTGTAVTIGSVVIPVLRAARISPVTTGAALLLGSSVGGELFNPGAPELLTTEFQSQQAAEKLNQKEKSNRFDPQSYNNERCVQRLLPLNIVSVLVATLAFWYLSLRYERRQAQTNETEAAPVQDRFQVNWLMAAVPLLPLAFLYLSSYPFNWFQLDPSWIAEPPYLGRHTKNYDTRLIGFAMLLGVAAAAVVVPNKVRGVPSAFFEGAGYGYAHIVSLIVVANCFGQAIREIGIAATIGNVIQSWPGLLMPTAGLLPLSFATLCGSGMATTQSLFNFFAEPALLLDTDPTHVGAVVSIASAAGRTMSPVAAVTLMCARMTDTTPLQLSKQVAVPLLISVAVVIIIAMIIAPAS
jgi:DcuC family C4-dicarboxylate transporter